MTKHTGEKSHQCKVCRKRFARSYDCTTHEASQHTKKAPLHVCSSRVNGVTVGCGRIFLKRGDLNRHWIRKSAEKCKQISPGAQQSQRSEIDQVRSRSMAPSADEAGTDLESGSMLVACDDEPLLSTLADAYLFGELLRSENGRSCIEPLMLEVAANYRAIRVLTVDEAPKIVLCEILVAQSDMDILGGINGRAAISGETRKDVLKASSDGIEGRTWHKDI